MPGGSSSIGGVPRLGIGQHAGSGIVMDNERSKSVGLNGFNQKKESLKAHSKFISHIHPHGHQTSNMIPSLLKNEKDFQMSDIVEKNRKQKKSGRGNVASSNSPDNIFGDLE